MNEESGSSNKIIRQIEEETGSQRSVSLRIFQGPKLRVGVFAW